MPEITPYRLTPEHHAGQDMHTRLLQSLTEDQEKPIASAVWLGTETVTPDDEYKYATREAAGTKSFDTFWMEQSLTSMAGSVGGWVVDQVMNGPAEPGFDGNEWIKSQYPDLSDGSPMSKTVVGAINQGWFDGARNPRSAEYRLKQAMTFTHEMAEAHAGFMGRGTWGVVGDTGATFIVQAGGDPTILLPGMALVKMGLQGSKAAARFGLASRSAIGAGAGGVINVAHLKALQEINPGLHIEGAEDELIAAGMGLAVGAILPVMGAATQGKWAYVEQGWSNTKIKFEARRLRKSWHGSEEGLQRAIDDLQPTTASGAAKHLKMGELSEEMRVAVKDNHESLDALLADTTKLQGERVVVSSLRSKNQLDPINQKHAKVLKHGKKQGWRIEEVEHHRQNEYGLLERLAEIVDNPSLANRASGSSLHYGPLSRMLGKVTGSYAKAQRWMNPGQRLAHNTHLAVQDFYRLLSGSAADLSEASVKNWRTNRRGTTAEGFTEKLHDAATETQVGVGTAYKSARRSSKEGVGINYDGQTHNLSALAGKSTWDKLVADYMRRRHDQARGFTGTTVPEDVHPSIVKAADDIDAFYQMMDEERIRVGLGDIEGTSPRSSGGKNTYAPVVYNLDAIRDQPARFVANLAEAMEVGNRLRGGKLLAPDEVPVDASVALEMNAAAGGKNLFHDNDPTPPTRPQSGMTHHEMENMNNAPGVRARVASAMERNEADGPVLVGVYREGKWHADTDTVIGKPVDGAKHGPHKGIESGADSMPVAAWGPVREVVVNGERRTAQYVLHETDAAKAGPPRSEGGSGVVRSIKDGPNTERLFTDGPTPHAGPAWLTHTGEVVNGRARTLGKQSAYKGKQDGTVRNSAIDFWEDLVPGSTVPATVANPDVSLILIGKVNPKSMRTALGKKSGGAEPLSGSSKLHDLFNTNEYQPGNFLKGVKVGDLDGELRIMYDNAMREHFRNSAERVRKTITDPTKGTGVVDGSTLPRHLQARSVNVPHSMIKDFLAPEAEATMLRYSHQVSGDIGIRRALLDNQEQMAPYAKMLGRPLTKPEDIIEVLDYHFNTMKEAADLVGDKILRQQISDTHKRVDRDLRGPMEMMRGNNLARSEGDFAGGLAYFGRNIQRYNFVRSLGSVAWAQLNDIAPQTLMLAANPRNLRMIPAALSWAKNFGIRDLQVLGLHTDRMGRARALGDLDSMTSPQFGFGSGGLRRFTAKLEEAAISGADISGHLSGMNWITSSMKRLGAMQTLQKIGDVTKKMVRVDELVQGGMPYAQAMKKMRLTEFWAGKMNHMGFDVKAARRFHRLTYTKGLTRNGKDIRSKMSYEKYMRNGKDLFLPNFDEWGSHITANRKLLDGLNGHMRDQVNRHLVVTPGQFDKPLMNKYLLGRMFNQFQTFMSAFLGQRLVPMSQMPANMQLWYYGNYMMLGALTDGITNHLSGRRSLSESGEMWLDNPAGMAYKAAAYSGITGPISRPLHFADALGFGPINTLSWLSGGESQDASFEQRGFGGASNALTQALGPTGGLAQTLTGVMQDVGTGNADARTAKRIASLVPFQNNAGLRVVHRAGRHMGVNIPIVPQTFDDDKKKKYRSRLP